MGHLQECLKLSGMLKALKCHRCELNFEFLYDLHHRHVIDEQKYLQKTFESIIDGGLWGDFIVVFWISNYLQHQIYVWNNNNGLILVKVGDQYDASILNIFKKMKQLFLIQNKFQKIINYNINYKWIKI